MRKSMSLPLVKPRVDRSAMAKSRPWRGDGASERPRFDPIGALQGLSPKLDARYLPYLQERALYDEAKQRVSKGRKFVAPKPKILVRGDDDDGWDDEYDGEYDGAWGGGGGDGTFMTNSVSMPNLAMRHRRRPPHRLPRMRSDGGAMVGISGGQEALDAQLASLNGRMARLGGGRRGGGGKRRLTAKAAREHVTDEATKEAIKSIRAALLRDMPRVIDLFRKFDRNGDGMVSRAEFREVLPILNLGGRVGAPQMDAVFDAVDADGSGFVDYTELQKQLRKGADVELDAALRDGAKGEIEVEARNKIALRTSALEGELSGARREVSLDEMRRAIWQNAARVIDMFRTLDRNGDFTVTKSEFRAALPLLGFDASATAAIDAVYAELDDNGNGFVEYEELNKALRRDDVELAAELKAGAVAFDVEARNRISLRTDAQEGTLVAHLRQATTVDELRRELLRGMPRIIDMFRAFDKDSDKAVTKLEFRAALPLLGVDSSSVATIDSIFDAIDADGNGWLAYEELNAALRKQATGLAEELQPGMGEVQKA